MAVFRVRPGAVSAIAPAIGYELIVGKKTRLLIQLSSQLLHATDEDLFFRLVYNQLAIDLINIGAKLRRSGALSGKLITQCLRLGSLIAQMILQDLWLHLIA